MVESRIKYTLSTIFRHQETESNGKNSFRDEKAGGIKEQQERQQRDWLEKYSILS